jgi:uncharacterized protein
MCCSSAAMFWLTSWSRVPSQKLWACCVVVRQGARGDLDYNDFLDVADAAVESLGLAGVLQVASFHPAYQFAGTAPDDAENLSNRSPYPTLHLLREASIDAAVAAFPEADMIYERNIETLRRLGFEGWRRLLSRDT